MWFKILFPGASVDPGCSRIVLIPNKSTPHPDFQDTYIYWPPLQPLQFPKILCVMCTLSYIERDRETERERERLCVYE